MNEVVTINDTKIRLHYFNTSDSKPLLLWISGGLVQEVRHVSPFLRIPSKQSFSLVLALDLAGISGSIQSGAANIIALSEYLCKKFSRDKLHLAGHCLGALPALHAAADRPDLFDGYIGVAQKVNHEENDRIVYYDVFNHAADNRDKTVLKRLYHIGPPPYEYEFWQKYRYLWKLLNRYYSHSDKSNGINLLFRVSKQLGWASIFSLWKNARSISQNYPYFIRSGAPPASLVVPVCFLHGRNDPVAIPEIIHQFFQRLEASRKTFVWFERSGHYPFYDEPEKFWRMVESFASKKE